jgi:hypothetical protein
MSLNTYMRSSNNGRGAPLDHLGGLTELLVVHHVVLNHLPHRHEVDRGLWSL